MNTAAAVEAVKILAPVLPRLVDAKDIVALTQRVTEHFAAENPSGFIRLIALMWRATPEEVKAQITRDGLEREGREAISMFFEGLKANPILELVMAGADLGMMSREEVSQWLSQAKTPN
jgi:hypothetical protein